MVNFEYFGESAALTAAIFWSFAVIVFRSASKSISPFLITALKNTIAFIAFILTFIVLDIPLWYNMLSANDYIKIIISGSLGMGFADAIFIYALSKIGANRVAVVNSFEPVSIYFFSSFMLGTMLTIQQLIGFMVVVASILIINYEKDADDINPKVKKRGMFLQVFAVLLSSFGIVLIKPVLSKVGSFVEVQLWITVFRLLPGVIIAWIIFLFQKNKIKLLYPLKNFKILWKVLLSSGLGTFLALSFWIIGYANISKPPIASILGQSSAVFIVILAWIFLKEKISKIRIISILLASFGVYLSVLR
ncbi:MAG: hypothetical protein CBD58_00275 [bacterium TMED198]|nr:MAG: hypothetical protein CBD58_00275 [bacterium TMED198]